MIIKCRKPVVSLISLLSIGSIHATEVNTALAIKQKPNIIIFVWDGLRPDSVTQSTTPNLYRLAHKGVWFNDNHSSYPTFTMMNGSSFATGDFAGKTGFFGNTLWQPDTKGTNASGSLIDFNQPVFTEDYKILKDLNQDEPLVEVKTLFASAHKNGITTTAVGKSGPAFFQDYKEKGVVFDENHIYPEAFANQLKNQNYPLPVNTIYRYQGFKLHKGNGNPTAYGIVSTLADGVTTNPDKGLLSPYNKDNTYLMDSYLTQVIPYAHPRLSVVWLRNPDTTEHNYGVGSKAYYNALANQDMLLGKLIKTLKQNRTWNNTDIIIVSDHGHSNVSGDLSEFPLHDINNTTNNIGQIDQRNGYSVSGDFRPADLLTRADFHAYDGEGCQYDPVLTGITADGKTVYPTKYDTTGAICGKAVKIDDPNGHRQASLGQKYTTPAYFVPKKLPKDGIVVAANGGSTYFYVPSHSQKLIQKLVRFLQSRQEFGAIFVDPRYGAIPGTLPLSLVKLENDHKRNPDIIAGSNFNATAKIKGYDGIEYNSSGSDRGMHGAFSPIDVHNTLIAFGPSFKKHFTDTLPSGNVDVAPTVAYILGISLPNTDGRVLLESLKEGKKIHDYQLSLRQYHPQKPAKNLIMQSAIDPDGKAVIKGISNYTIALFTKQLIQNGKTYVYFDQAKALRY
ncbi:alkaline phosphatase family protein [Facilibium subflavum]|uniref:alkaline phosphatase family protein n=1 Tax=Facilibium subflavum TaxID=2219058 RepID=UPI000E649687|nr:alkaline phosphatase family protein [Facilibium subflavum]